jgi:hypothetical protein
MTDEQMRQLVKECGLDWHRGFMLRARTSALAVRCAAARFLLSSSAFLDL